MAAVRQLVQTIGFRRNSTAPHLSGHRKPPSFLRNYRSPLLLPPSPVFRYPAKLRLPALGLEPRCFQNAYGATTDRSLTSAGVPLRDEGSKVQLDFSDYGFPEHGGKVSSSMRPQIDCRFDLSAANVTLSMLLYRRPKSSGIPKRSRLKRGRGFLYGSGNNGTVSDSMATNILDLEKTQDSFAVFQ